MNKKNNKKVVYRIANEVITPEAAADKSKKQAEVSTPLKDASTITLSINGKKVEAKQGMTILEAARNADIYIPTLCYHEKLSNYGACRLCTVEITSGSR